jgi:hypothetical protein
MCLEGGLLKETPFPFLKRRPSSVEDSIVSLFPNQPCSQDFFSRTRRRVVHHYIKKKLMGTKIPLQQKQLPRN